MKIKSGFRLLFIFLVLIIFIACAGTESVTPSGTNESSHADSETPVITDKTGGGRDASGTVAETESAAAPVETPKSSAAEKDLDMFKGDSEDTSERSPEGFSTMTSPSTSLPSPRSTVPEVSGLKAGFADDNKQFNYFLSFLDKYRNVKHYDLPITERIIISVTDSQGKPIPNAAVSFSADGTVLVEGKTLSDGTYQFNPGEFDPDIALYLLKVEGRTQSGKESREVQVERDGPRTVTVRLDEKRSIGSPIPLDVLFIMDTTGSMGEEIERLKATIEIIYLNVTSMPVDIDLRFGMVLYKDREDEYLTKTIPLTSDLDSFITELNAVYADGGGDTPEDMQEALRESIQGIVWSDSASAIRLGFLITDAPPQFYKNQTFTYDKTAKEARAKAIKIFTIGTGGLDISGEYILRQISQYTMGRYIFLTYGETGESEGGAPGSVSHHTGTNYQTDKLESIIIRFTKEEISNLTDTPLPADDPYFEAKKVESEAREVTLRSLFAQAVDQLVDFSTMNITDETTVALLPITDSDGNASVQTEYFTAQLLLSSAANKRFVLVERQDMDKILDEIKRQLSGLFEGKNTEEIGNLLDADLLITARMYTRTDYYEIFLKLLRVMTGEVLGVTKAKIDLELGL